MISTEPQQSPIVADDPDYTLALEEARRNFDSQARQLADLRKRAVDLVGIGGLAATFIGGLSASKQDGLNIWHIVALCAFVFVVATASTSRGHGYSWRRKIRRLWWTGRRCGQ